MVTYDKVSHKLEIKIAIIVLISCTVLAILFGFLYSRELKKRPLIKYPTYTLSTKDWTSGDVVISVTNPSEKIESYSFDGGTNFQESNEYSVKENGNYVIVVKDINGRLSKTTPLVVRNIDKNPPVINFENKTTVQLNSTFNLRTGVIVTDEESGLHDSYVVTPKEIDTSIPGTYTVTYSAYDKVGNSTTKERTITVNDIKGVTYYRYRTAKVETYECEPYLCNCVTSNTAFETKSCEVGYTFEEPNKCCKTCYKVCKKNNWGEWSNWSTVKVNPSSTVEVETEIRDK